MEEYITVKSESCGEYSEKHSRFLGFLIPCDSAECAAHILEEKRKKYWDAKHAVYAYVLSDGTARFSDDGEPHGTAGKPILDIIMSSGIKNVIIVVVRYFGGILLGTGGLVRAYSAAASKAIANGKKVKVSVGDLFFVNIDYAKYDKLNFILRESGAEIKSTDFDRNVKVSFAINSDRADNCIKRIKDAFSSSVQPEFDKKIQIFEKI